jgi:hypothetical protein
MKLDNKNIFCSVSAGYSSVMMAIKLHWFPNHNIINVMANTSKEREESLHFMNECKQKEKDADAIARNNEKIEQMKKEGLI